MPGTECVLCRQSTDDEVQLGKKYTCNGVTAHYYCLLLTSNLVQKGADDEGICGFLPKDIKAEVNRASKLFCAYCKEKTATIGCCIRACRKSFHLPCALKNECRLEFTDPFKSFCNVHNGIKKPKNVHKPNDSCTICYDDMGTWDPIQSIQSPCCNRDSWYHKLCLMKYAQTSGYFLKCPLCKDSDQFRDSIAKRGVFIPDRDAQWEETGPNAFYDFQQHSDRPNECEAKKCKCSRGRNYEAPEENHKYAFIYCHYCGGHGVHRGCNLGEIFLCEECSTVRHDTTEDAIIDLSNLPAPPRMSTVRNSYNSHDGRRKENIVAIIDLGDSDEDYVVTYSETTAESKTVSLTRTTVCYPLRDCSVQIPRIDRTQLANSTMEKSSDDAMVFDVSDDSVLGGNVSRDSGSNSDSECTDEVVPSLFSSSESDEETRSADEAECSSSPIRINYSDHSDGFDVHENSNKVFSSNMMPFGYKEKKNETRSESSGIESISNSHISSSSQTPEHHRNMVHTAGESSDGSIDCIASSIRKSFNRINSSASSSSSRRISSETASTISIQSKDISDGEQLASEPESLPNQMNAYAVKEERVTIKTELDDSPVSKFSSSSPNKRKRLSDLRYYFGETSTSDDDVIEVKQPKRKAAKRSPKTMLSRAPNQRSISDMFIKLNNSF